MRRLTALFVSVGILLSLFVPVASATGPVVSIALDQSSAAVGDKVVLTVSVTGVTDLYGSSIDLFYDSALLEPTVDSTVTTPAGVVTQGLSSSQYFTSTLSGTSGQLSRATLIALRLGQQGGASGDGVVGKIEFTTKAAGNTTFALATGNPSAGNGVVSVNFVSSTGSALSFGMGASQTLTVAATTLTIDSPASGAVLGSSTVTVTGTASGGATVGVTLDTTTALSGTASAAGAYSVTFNSVADGAHSLVANLGAVSTSAVPFVVDTAAPQVTIDAIATPAASVTVTGTYTDQNIDKIYVQVNPGAGSPGAADQATVDVTNHTYSKVVSLVNGSNLIRATAADKAGHTGTAETTVNYFTLMPYLHLVFDKTTYAPGDTVLVDAVMENIPSTLGGITAEFRYDTTRLSVYDVIFTNTLLGGAGKQSVVKTDDPEVGVVLVNITNPNGIAAGKNKALQLQFTVKANAVSGNASVNFAEVTTGATGGNGTLFLDRSQVPIPDGNPISGAAVISTGGRLVGTFRLIGRAGNPPDYSGIIVTVLSGTTPVASGTTISDGSVDIGAIPPGTYTVRLTKHPYLTLDVTNVPINAGASTSLTSMNLGMLPGNIADNASSSDTVFLEDLGALATAWGATPSSGAWNANADLDGGGSVFLSDLGLLATYWGKTGATRTGSTQIFTYTAP
ncbi:MAG TPA: hypothetical protein VGK74_15545 [Symbiobacteriaceae bacterium]